MIWCYTSYEVVFGISGPVWSWNARTRLPEILVFRLNKTRALVLSRLLSAEHLHLKVKDFVIEEDLKSR